MNPDRTPSTLYGAGSRALQDHFDSRRLADRLVELTLHCELTEEDIALVAAQKAVWLATVDADGWPDVSYKGGAPGFVQVTDPRHLRMPSYDGNGMFRSLGNITDNGRVALLFVDSDRPWRMRVHGTARVSTAADALADYPGAEAVVEIEVRRVFPNCGRYVHAGDAISESVPSADHVPPQPDWKQLPQIEPFLPGNGDRS